eukprot:TRINITY_DN22493_c0_g1_i1.p1 TRINITY_DN22493_c0_g1~~TRINITY_DN22493_c0_g1_i1.p1  ORF type:complete len:147 (-),score=11.37 TRINITY_DN22493_c0_g1_i1:93-533(-)
MCIRDRQITVLRFTWLLAKHGNQTPVNDGAEGLPVSFCFLSTCPGCGFPCCWRTGTLQRSLGPTSQQAGFSTNVDDSSVQGRHQVRIGERSRREGEQPYHTRPPDQESDPGDYGAHSTGDELVAVEGAGGRQDLSLIHISEPTRPY